MQAPQVAATGQLPAVEKLCQPETRTLIGYTRRVLRLTGADGCRFVCQPKPGRFLPADSATIYRFRMPGA
jgi:hypothetical protein